MYLSHFAAFLHCSDSNLGKALSRYCDVIATLSNCSSVLLKSPPPGCAIFTASDKCEVHLLLKVDVYDCYIISTLLIYDEFQPVC